MTSCYELYDFKAMYDEFEKQTICDYSATKPVKLKTTDNVNNSNNIRIVSTKILKKITVILKFRTDHLQKNFLKYK